MQLKHIEYFVETSNYRSFNEAAKNLFISQPSLSAAIATLERELGFALFHRTKHGIALTTAGELILPEARQMLAIQRHWQTLSQKLALFEQPLKIYAQELLCSTILVDLTMKLAERYPSLNLSLETVEKFAIGDHLEENAIILDFYDLTQFDELKQRAAATNWTIMPVSPLQSLLYLNAKHPLATKDPLLLADLRQLRLSTYAINQINAQPYRNLATHFAAVATLPSREGMFNHIRSHPQYGGVFSSLCCYYPYVQNGAIVPRTIADCPLPVYLAAIFPKDKDVAPFYESIVDEICAATHAFIAANNIPQ